MAYDPGGRLYQSVGAGVTTRFLYDGAQIVAEYNASNVLQRRFVPGPGLDEPIVWYEGAGVSDRRWLIADERGSVIAITGAGGAATSINSYDEYGIPRAGNVGRFGFAGQAWLAEVALTHSRARAYAPSAGRFVQTDPIGVAGGMNLYAYVGNDPVNFSDPWGLCEVNSTVVDGVEEFTGTCPPPPDWSTPFASIADWLAQNGGIALLNRWEVQAAARVAGMETFGGGGHDYTTSNRVCRGALSEAQQAAALSTSAFPGQNPNQPVANHSTNLVTDPTFFGVPGGFVTTTTSNGGRTITNRTTPFHVFSVWRDS